MKYLRVMIGSGSKTPTISVCAGPTKERDMSEVEITNESVEAYEAAFKRDSIVFKENLPHMLREYPGEFVAIHNGEILDHNESWDELVSITKSKHPEDYVFIDRVAPPSNVTIEIDSLDT